MKPLKEKMRENNIIFALSFWLGISIIIDYICTLYFSGSVENLTNNEHSLLLIYAVKHEILIPYGLFIMVLYSSCSYYSLRALRNQKIFPAAFLSVALIAISHTFGGLSWYIRSALYSKVVLALPVIAFGLMISCFVCLLIWKIPAPARSSS
ncbi:hypothetical protein CW713_02930 [Methanophagales archaeon]|nr:MAG: hypothetical protein CW713_02930 [Methanophagales archaeon]